MSENTMNEPLDLATATEQALDYAATRCRACASGTLRCQRHADEDDFIADTLEKFGEALQQQVYEAEADAELVTKEYCQELISELEGQIDALLTRREGTDKLRVEIRKIIRKSI